jgi:hypothetical protein
MGYTGVDGRDTAVLMWLRELQVGRDTAVLMCLRELQVGGDTVVKDVAERAAGG